MSPEDLCARCGHERWCHLDFYYRPRSCAAKDEGGQCMGFVEPVDLKQQRIEMLEAALRGVLGLYALYDEYLGKPVGGPEEPAILAAHAALRDEPGPEPRIDITCACGASGVGQGIMHRHGCKADPLRTEPGPRR